MIDGYYDEFLQAMNGIPAYLGGDQTVSPWVSIDNPSTKLLNTPVMFNTGVQDYTKTSQYEEWLDMPTITVPTTEYTSLTKVANSLLNPWKIVYPLEGTNGLQFAPK
jgi:hypothetical protein